VNDRSHGKNGLLTKIKLKKMNGARSERKEKKIGIQPVDLLFMTRAPSSRRIRKRISSFLSSKHIEGDDHCSRSSARKQHDVESNHRAYRSFLRHCPIELSRESETKPSGRFEKFSA